MTSGQPFTQANQSASRLSPASQSIIFTLGTLILVTGVLVGSRTVEEPILHA